MKLAFTALGAALPGVGHAVGHAIEKIAPHVIEKIAHRVALDSFGKCRFARLAGSLFLCCFGCHK